MTSYLAASDSQAGPIGLALVVVLGIAIAFLGRSMSHHIKKVPTSFDKPTAPKEAPTSPEPAVTAETATSPENPADH